MYLVFFGDNYYPTGGWRDYAGKFSSIDKALTFILQHSPEWWQIVDLATLKIVKEG